MVALTSMILKPHTYEIENPERSENAEAIAKCLKMSLFQHIESIPRDYIFLGNWMDPGPIFDVYACLEEFRV